MALMDIHDMEFLKNEAEGIVLAELERQLDSFPDYICKCKDCLLDMLACALNSVKPLYRVTLMGSIYAGVALDEKAYATSIREGVFKAIEKVYKNPSHPLEERPEVKEEKEPFYSKHTKVSKRSSKKQ